MDFHDAKISIDEYEKSQQGLQSVCLFGSLCYLLLHRLGTLDRVAWAHTSISQYVIMFIATLQDNDVKDKWNILLEEKEEEGERKAEFETLFRKHFIKALSIKLQS